MLRTRSAYQNSLDELSKYASVYNENMSFVFEKCQQMEVKRTRFFVEMLSGLQQILVDLSSPAK